MTDRHAKRRKPSDRDLQDNPGIGSAKGSDRGKAQPEDLEELEGDNTFEGDVENDLTPQGGVDPRHIGRTNK